MRVGERLKAKLSDGASLLLIRGKDNLMKEKFFIGDDGKPVGVPSLRPSFRSAISRAERQVEYGCYRGSERAPLLHELCCIMAEIYMMDPGGKVRISGEWLDAYLVQEVFGEIGHEHVETVMAEFSRLCCDIQNKKAYLRTMLYNSVFTLEADSVNDGAKLEAELKAELRGANFK